MNNKREPVDGKQFLYEPPYAKEHLFDEQAVGYLHRWKNPAVIHVLRARVDIRQLYHYNGVVNIRKGDVFSVVAANAKYVLANFVVTQPDGDVGLHSMKVWKDDSSAFQMSLFDLIEHSLEGEED